MSGSWGQQKPPLGSQLMPGHPLAQGLVGCWLANEGGGSRLLDCAGTSYGDLGGTAGTIGFSPSVKGPALRFQSGADWVQLPIGAINNALNGQAWSMRVRFVAAAAGNATRNILLGNGGQANARQMAFDWLEAGKLRVAEENVAFILTSVSSIATGDFVDAVWTVTGTSHRLYMNSTLEASGTYTFSSAYTNNYRFGGNSDDPVGWLLDAQVYNRALTAGEIAWLYVDPYAFIAPPRPHRAYSIVGSGFNPAWAHGANRLIGSGMYV